MPFPELKNDRFTPRPSLRVTVQVPETHLQKIVEAVITKDALKYGDYDCVTFKTARGVQQFRSLGTGRNVKTERAVEVPCCELSFFLEHDETIAIGVLKAIYNAHPYEEPVIALTPCIRTLHIRGRDEDNPNRFWNSVSQDWVPEEHR